MLGKKKRSFTEPRKLGPPRPERIQMPAGTFFRMFILGSVSVVACIWAVYHHYTVPPQRMLVPVPSATEVEIDLSAPPP